MKNLNPLAFERCRRLRDALECCACLFVLAWPWLLWQRRVSGFDRTVQSPSGQVYGDPIAHVRPLGVANHAIIGITSYSIPARQRLQRGHAVERARGIAQAPLGVFQPSHAGPVQTLMQAVQMLPGARDSRRGLSARQTLFGDMQRLVGRTEPALGHAC